MLNWINKKFQEYFLKKWIAKDFRELKEETRKVYEKNGYGVYLQNIYQGSKPDFFGKEIAKYSKDIVHSVFVFYLSDEFKYKVSQNIWQKINEHLNKYYKDKTKNFLNIPILVIGSADKIGITVCSASNYQDRKYTLRKLPLTDDQILKLLEEVVETLGDPYDSTGIVGWLFKIFGKLFNKFLDDQKTFYCSELCYEKGKLVGLKLANVENPSPGDIEDCNVDWIVHKTF